MALIEQFSYDAERKPKARRSRQALRLRFIEPDGREVDEDAARLLAGLIKRSPLTLGEIAAKAEVAPATVANLLYGDTTRPHALTLAKVAGVFGYRLVFTKVH